MALNTAQSKEAGRVPLPINSRKDTWWIKPLLVFLGLSTFGIYATWRAFENRYYSWGPYLSPFYSPFLVIHIGHFAISPALLILPFPLIFRMTCYYYRGAYYRAFFWDPPACAVEEPAARKQYTGESRFPFTIQNLHRFAFYIAVIFIAILAADAIIAFDFNGHFGMGLGTLIMVVNVLLLSFYTFSCHSFRHLIGGALNCYSCSRSGKTRFRIWQRISLANERHMLFAWLSLFTVGFTDLYIRLVSAGIIHDVRFF